jgi:hypothetical protein
MAMGLCSGAFFVCGYIFIVITTIDHRGDTASVARSDFVRRHRLRGEDCLVASGKGGVSRSTTVSSLSLLLARSGMDPAVIDLDAAGADLHAGWRVVA